MATIIDALLVEIGIDGTKLKAGARQSQEAFKGVRADADKTARDLNVAGKSGAEAIGRIRTEALALFAVLTGGRSLRAFAADTIQTTSALGRLSAVTGQSARDLSALQNAARLAGASAATVGSAYAKMQQQFQTPEGRAALLNTARQAHVTVTDAKGQLLGITDIYRNLNAGLSQLARTNPGKAQVLGGQLGFSGDDLAWMEEDPSKWFAQFQKGMANAATPAQTAAMQQLVQDFAQLREDGEGFGRALLTDIEPALDRILKGVDHFIKAHPEAAEAIFGGALVARLAVPLAIGTASLGRAAGGAAVGALGNLLGFGPAEAALTASGATLEGAAASLIAAAEALEAAAVAQGAEGGGVAKVLKRAGGGAGAAAAEAGVGAAATRSGLGGLFRLLGLGGVAAAAAGIVLTPGNIGQTPGDTTVLPPAPADVEAQARAVAAGVGIDPDTFVSLIRKESGGRQIDPRTGKTLTSSAGALGLTQLMPATAADLNDAGSNMLGGALYFRQLLERYGGNKDAALIAYNGGMRRADRWIKDHDWSALPAETRDYVARIDATAGNLRNGGGGKAVHHPLADLGRKLKAGIGHANDATYGDDPLRHLPMPAMPDLSNTDSAAAYSAALLDAARGQASGDVTHHTETHVSGVTINVRSTDPKGAAREVAAVMSNPQALATRAGSGLQ